MNGSDLSRITTSNSRYILQLQKYLRVLSYEYSEIPIVVENGIFDEQTENALKMFQTLAGLEPTGTSDPLTWEVLRKQFLTIQDSNIEPVYFDAYPSIHSAQLAFQTLSAAYDNFITSDITGILDQDTMENIKELRKVSLLPEGTLLDIELWNILILIHNSIQ